VRLVICDDQRILAEALAAALGERGHQVLAVTTSWADGVAAVSAGRPDVCILDLEFADEPGGLEGARLIGQRYPGTKVLILSAFADPRTLSLVNISDVAGFLRKDQTVDQITSALEIIASGGRVLAPGLIRIAAAEIKRPQPMDPLRELSPREKEIVARIVGGQSTRQMSFAMNITVDTVRTYVKNVLAKFGAHSRLQLAAIVSRDGLLGDQEPAGRVFALAGRQAHLIPSRVAVAGTD
jgi:two-component system, NarL family, nitrate/nitrite response regulator NarL